VAGRERKVVQGFSPQGALCGLKPRTTFRRLPGTPGGVSEMQATPPPFSAGGGLDAGGAAFGAMQRKGQVSAGGGLDAGGAGGVGAGVLPRFTITRAL